MDALIFDIDGTLWDSTESVAQSWNDVIRKHSDLQITLTGEELKKLFGQPMDVILNAVFPTLSACERKHLGELCFAFENTWLLEHPGTLFPEVRETLGALSRKLPLYIVSNCQCGYVEAFLQSSALTPYFKGHLCFGDTNQTKDKTLRLLMEQHNLKNATYIGDTQGDYDACQQAGIPFIFASYGFGQIDDTSVVSIDKISRLKEFF